MCKEQIMPEFNNIRIVKKADVYFDGKVTRRGITDYCRPCIK